MADIAIETEPMFLVDEFAEIHRMTRRAVIDLIGQKKLGAVRVGYKSYRIPRSAAAEFQRSNLSSATAERAKSGAA